MAIPGTTKSGMKNETMNAPGGYFPPMSRRHRKNAIGATSRKTAIQTA
jgi:hypothetical protein